MAERSYEGIGGCAIMVVIFLFMLILVVRYFLIG